MTLTTMQRRARCDQKKRDKGYVPVKFWIHADDATALKDAFDKLELQRATDHQEQT